MPTYTFTNYQDQVIDPLAFPNASNSVTVLNVLNRAARNVVSELDLRSTKRRAALTPNLFDDVYQYTCPADLKGDALIDLMPQANRSLDSRLNLVQPETFDRKKSIYKNMVAVFDDDFTRKILADLDVDDTKLAVSNLDSLSAGGGTWATFSAGSTNVVVDTDNYVEGSGSIKFDLVAGTTTGGIVNTDLNDLDITDYVIGGSLLVWAYINSTTDLTNFIVRIGSDASNYYTQTITTTHEGLAFQAGWNLLRFSFASMTETGTVTDAAIDYLALCMTKASGKEDDGYRFDDIQLHTGQIYDVVYYSKYPWQTSAGSYIENSTTPTDKINADTDEFELFVQKGKVEMFRELKEYDQMKLAQVEYDRLKGIYLLNNRSERIKMQIKYY